MNRRATLKNAALEGHAETPISRLKFRTGDRIRRRADSRNILVVGGHELQVTSGARTADEKREVKFKVVDVRPGWYLLRATWLKRRKADWEPSRWVDDNCELDQ